MKKTIRKRVYDTETAERLAAYNVSYFGDPAGYSETLYKTEDGHYFLHGQGGEGSPYAKESLKPLSAANAEKWLAAHPAG
ncbi:MAG TPA: hypothetical protein H9674_00550 [Firmicutes bacterium]|mgnify:CR=1 FL=1|nr:hypothetical protein [Bacillota bacterium]